MTLARSRRGALLVEDGDTQRRVCGDAALAADDLVQTVQRYLETAGGFDLSVSRGFRNSSSRILPLNLVGWWTRRESNP